MLLKAHENVTLAIQYLYIYFQVDATITLIQTWKNFILIRILFPGHLQLHLHPPLPILPTYLNKLGQACPQNLSVSHLLWHLLWHIMPNIDKKACTRLRNMTHGCIAIKLSMVAIRNQNEIKLSKVYPLLIIDIGITFLVILQVSTLLDLALYYFHEGSLKARRNTPRPILNVYIDKLVNIFTNHIYNAIERMSEVLIWSLN